MCYFGIVILMCEYDLFSVCYFGMSGNVISHFTVFADVESGFSSLLLYSLHCFYMCFYGIQSILLHAFWLFAFH